MHGEVLVITLVAIATTVALAARWLKVPYTVALVATGLALGGVHGLRPPHLTRELLYAVFLPGLLFEAAFHLEFRHYWRHRIAVHALALPGVAVAVGLTALLVAGAAHALDFAPGFGLASAVVFAALIAATDPIAVVALFKTLGAPPRLAVLVEGESLLNDGTAVVIFTLVVGVAAGHGWSAAGLALGFFWNVGAGALVGSAVGFAATAVIRRVDDAMIEFTVTTLAAYGAFVAAERGHVSGVIATVVAGMLCGNVAAPTGMSPATRAAVGAYWEYVAFVLNSLVFLLLGFTVRVGAMLAAWRGVLAAWVAVTLGRAAVSYLVTALLRRSRERLPWAWSAVLTWGGLRGALSLVLALGLPDDFPQRAALVTLTSGVVVLSIVVQGLSMAPLLRALSLVHAPGGPPDVAAARLWLLAAEAVLAATAAEARAGTLPADLAAALTVEFTREADARGAEVHNLRGPAGERPAETVRAARRRLLLAAQTAVEDGVRQGLAGRAVAARVVLDFKTRLDALDSAVAQGRDEPEIAPVPSRVTE